MKLHPSSIWVLAVLAGLVTIGPLSTDMYLPAQPAIKAELGATIDQIQLTLSVFLIGTSIALPFWGPLADRYGRRPILIAGVVLFIIASAACALVESIEALIVYRFLQAIGASVGPILGRTMIRDIYKPEDAAKAFAYLATMMALAPAIAPILGGFLLIQLDWRAIFYTLALLSLISTLFYLTLIGETLKPELRQSIHPRSIMNNYQKLMKDRGFIAYTLIMSSIFSGLFAFISVAAFIIIEFLQLSPQQFGFCFLFMVLGFMVGSSSGAKLSATVATTKLILAGISFAGFGALLCLGLSLAEVFHPLSVIVPIGLYGVGSGLILPQCTAASLRNYPEMAGTASSLSGIIQNTAAAIAGVSIALLHSDSPTILGYFLVGAALFAWLIFYTWLPKEERRIN